MCKHGLQLQRILLFRLILPALLFGVTAVNGLAQRPTYVEKEPYLVLSGDGNDVRVLWQLSADAVCTVAWGSDTSYGLGSVQTSEYGNDHQHAFTFPDLDPGLLYYYLVAAAGDNYAGSFRTAPLETAATVKFLGYGDTRSSPQIHDGVAEAMISTFTADPAYRTFTLHSGDLVSDGDLEGDWAEEFFDPQYTNIRGMMANLPLLACIGNHEGSGQLFVKYFPYPYVGGRYWSFDYGPAHVVIVDQLTSYSPGSAQLAWLQNDLATSDKPWKFMLFHKPGWSAGGGHANEIPVQEYLQPLCVAYGVSVCFAGHNHYYAHCLVEGVHHITSGGGGAPLYSPNLSYPYVVAAASEYHYCKVEITGDLLSFAAVTPTGQLLDSFTVENLSGVDDGMPSREGMPLMVFPNPFNPETTIQFTLAEPQLIELAVYDLGGRKVDLLAYTYYGAGVHRLNWNGEDGTGRAVRSGSYLIRIVSPQGIQVEKLTLVR
jgi:hypothetical protein